MKKLIAILVFAAALGVGGLLVWTAFFSKPVEVDEDYANNLRLIEEMKYLDARWSLAAIDAYHDPLSSFDQLAAFIPRYRELRSNLEEGALNKPATPTVVKNKLRRYLLLMESKEASIETFKANFAVVRNSMNYLPLAEGALEHALKTTGNAELVKEIQDIQRRVRVYIKKPEEGLRGVLLMDLTKLEQKLMSFPTELSNPLGNFIVHSRALVKRQLELSENVKTLLSRDSELVANELLGSCEKLHEQKVEEHMAHRDDQRVLVAGLSGTLTILAAIAALFWLFREQTFNRKVSMAVSERTRDLEASTQEAAAGIVDKNLDQSIEGTQRLAATLAHEINTPLGYLDSNLQVMSGSMSKFDELMAAFKQMRQSAMGVDTLEGLRQHIQSFSTSFEQIQDEAMLDELPDITSDMRDGVEHIKHVVGELKDFTRKDLAERDSFRITECAERAIKMAKESLDENTKVVTDFQNVPELFGSPAEINQVLINLISNAGQSITEAKREKGVIKVRIYEDKSRVFVSILDNGTGIDSETSARIFDPFFTTKTVGKGTGLGLAISRRIITNHGGKIMVKSSLGKGSNFAFFIPVKDHIDNEQG